MDTRPTLATRNLTSSKEPGTRARICESDCPCKLLYLFWHAACATLPVTLLRIYTARASDRNRKINASRLFWHVACVTLPVTLLRIYIARASDRNRKSNGIFSSICNQTFGLSEFNSRTIWKRHRRVFIERLLGIYGFPYSVLHFVPDCGLGSQQTCKIPRTRVRTLSSAKYPFFISYIYFNVSFKM